MTQINRILAVGTFALLSLTTQNAYAMLPACSSPSSDSDGDGFGWENDTSCAVMATTAPAQLPGCNTASDPDGDGFGWENGASCLVGGDTTTNTGGDPICSSADSDSDGDGFGWENGQTCLVSASAAPVSTGSTFCASSSSDSDGDGFGWENGASCVVISPDGGSSTSNGIVTDESPDETTTNDGGSFSSGDGGSIIRTTSLPTVGAQTLTVNSDGGDQFSTVKVGDFLLMQNAWRAWRAASGYAWNQSIYTNNNGAPIGWNYDWGPGVPGANGRASDDYYVRSYPELIFGIKDEFRTSAPKAQIGFPVRVDAMPTTKIDYAFDAPQYGSPRTVDASVNSSYPNGTTISGERNVAVESFFYNSVDGACTDDLPVTRSGGSNHVYEVMVWLDSGAERLPASPRDYVTTVSLRGQSYKVYTKNSDNRYIAFVAQNPQTTGTIYWNDFLDWSRIYAHRVQQDFGASSNSVQIQDSWCVANIIIGTEIFWGAGNFDLYDWNITQQQ